MPVAVVQETELQQTTASATWSLNFASAVTTGNVVVLVARIATASRTPSTPTTSGSGTFASVTSAGTGVGSLWMWSLAEGGTGNTAYSLTFASGLSAAGILQAYELSGANSETATSTDANVGQASSTSPRMTTASGLTVASGGIMIGAISTTLNLSWGTLTDPANFNRDFATNSLSIGSFLAAHSTTAASGVTGTATITTARAVNGLAATWIEAPTGGGPFPHFIRRRMFGGMTFPRGGV
jgi:hypothetical protein